MVRREVVLAATREEVWAALTRSEELSAWFGADVEIDPRPRGPMTARAADGSVRRGTVVAANAPWRLVLAWEPEAGETEGSHVELTLEDVEDGVRLTVVERPLTPDESGRFLLAAAR